MQGSNLGLRIWAIAFYLMAKAESKETASMKLHRDLGITQKTAWHLAHRIRESWTNYQPAVSLVPVEEFDADVYRRQAQEYARRHKRESMTLPGIPVLLRYAIAGVKDQPQ